MDKESEHSNRGPSECEEPSSFEHDGNSHNISHNNSSGEIDKTRRTIDKSGESREMGTEESREETETDLDNSREMTLTYNGADGMVNNEFTTEEISSDDWDESVENIDTNNGNSSPPQEEAEEQEGNVVLNPEKETVQNDISGQENKEIALENVCPDQENVPNNENNTMSANTEECNSVDIELDPSEAAKNVQEGLCPTQKNTLKAKTGGKMAEDTSQLMSHIGRLVDFEKEYRKDPVTLTVCDRLKIWVRRKCESTSAKKIFLSNLPFITMFRNYKREDLVPDLIAGSTAGAMMIPQGMAFGALSTLPPIVGLYISLFAPLTYFFLGTCRQISMGCIAVLSLMMADILDLYDSKMKTEMVMAGINYTSVDVTSSGDNMTTLTMTQDTESLVQSKRIEVAAAVTFTVGMITILLSKLGLGFVTCFMSNSLITSFTVGVSIHVFTSQLKNGLGLKLERKTGLFKLPKTWYDVCIHLPETNIATLITWFVCIIIIYLVKAQINERFKKWLKIPIPIELFMVILGTVSSYFIGLNANYNVKIVKSIPKGIPPPHLPDVTLATDYITDGILIAVVSYAQTVALAKTFGLLHQYEIDPDQEMFACGAANVVCSLFSGYITAASVSRSMVVNGAGGKTQVQSLIACSIVLLVIVVLAPYFYYLPLCVLAAIICVNLRGMFWKLTQLNPLRKQSKSDFIVWVVTFSVSVFVDVIPGLLAGIAVSFLLIIIITQQSPVTLKGVVDGTSESRSPSTYHCVNVSPDIKILNINKPLCFANSDIFVQKVFKNTEINIIAIRKQRAKQEKLRQEKNHSNHNKNTEVPDMELMDNLGKTDAPKVDVVTTDNTDHPTDIMVSVDSDIPVPKYVVLDLSGVSFIDLMGSTALQLVIRELGSIDVEVFITNVAGVVYEALDRMNFVSHNKDRLYLSIFDALREIQSRQESSS